MTDIRDYKEIARRYADTRDLLAAENGMFGLVRPWDELTREEQNFEITVFEHLVEHNVILVPRGLPTVIVPH